MSKTKTIDLTTLGLSYGTHTFKAEVFRRTPVSNTQAWTRYIGKCPPPTISIEDISEGKKVTITPATGYSFMYAWDGTPSISSSTTVTHDITTVSSGTCNAYSYKTDYANSDTATLDWRVTTLSSPTLTVYTSNQGFTLTDNSGVSGAEIRYTLDGSTPVITSTLYSGRVYPTDSCQVKAKCFCVGYNTSNLESGYYYLYGTLALTVGNNVKSITYTANGTTNTITESMNVSYPKGTVITVSALADDGYRITSGASGTYTMTSGAQTYAPSASEAIYLTFVPSTGTVSVTPNSNWDATTKEYSTDNGITWSTYSSGAISGTCVAFRGTGGSKAGSGTGGYSANRWTITGTSISAYGNIETILDYATVIAGNHPTLGTGAFYMMFYNATNLVKPPKLKSLTLSSSCYVAMFYGSGIVYPPEILATTLATQCCAMMFYGCTSLVNPPLFHATVMADHCYTMMFYNCTSLTSAPTLSSTSLAKSCYESMFSHCTALIDTPALPATTLAERCYMSMFEYCTSLESIPMLRATTMQKQCYAYLFYHCTSFTVYTSSGTGHQNSFRLPPSGTGTSATEWNDTMLYGTGGGFTSNPSINTTYYMNLPFIG